MKKWTAAAACALILAAGVAYTQQTPKNAGGAGKLNTLTGKVSYGIGLNVGENLKQMQEHGAQFDAALIYQGIQDALAGKEPAIADDELQAALRQFERDLRHKQQEINQKQAQERVNADPELKALADKEKQAGDKFLAENRQKKDVKTTKSGLQYLVLKDGTGKTPTLDDIVTVHYEGKLIDQTTFESSYQSGRPATFAVADVIRGWTEALQLMKQGSKWRLFIPPDLAYGYVPQPGSKIPINAVLVFDVELLQVGIDAPEAAPATGQTGQPKTQSPQPKGSASVPKITPKKQAQQPKATTKR
jgi:FKBP-type peptidyl-prolyl cis-trans isomerase